MASIPTGFKGTLHAFYRVSEHYSYVTWIAGNELEHYQNSEGWIDLDAYVDVDVDFADPRAAIIAGLQKNIEAEKAASFSRVALMLGKIQELQAIEAKPAEKAPEFVYDDDIPF
jgi:hypothetical protein